MINQLHRLLRLWLRLWLRRLVWLLRIISVCQLQFGYEVLLLKITCICTSLTVNSLDHTTWFCTVILTLFTLVNLHISVPQLNRSTSLLLICMLLCTYSGNLSNDCTLAMSDMTDHSDVHNRLTMNNRFQRMSIHLLSRHTTH